MSIAPICHDLHEKRRTNHQRNFSKLCYVKVRIAVPFHQLGTENFMIVVIQHKTSQSLGLPTTLLDGALEFTSPK